MKYSHVAIIIPTFNEAENISSLVKEILQVVPGAQVVIVDDNSPDGTAKIVEENFAKENNVSLVRGTGKQGRGAAALRGFRFAHEKLLSKVFIEMDADHSHEPELLPAMISKITPTTVVCASRYLSGSSITSWSKFRTIFSYLSNSSIRLILESPLSDNTNGYRAYPVAAIEALLETKLVTKNYLVLAETTALLTKKGFKYLEIPSHFPNRTAGVSNTNFKLIIQSIKDLTNIWWKYL
ncbi:MAG: hypothetical protein COU65_03650 [Candidatus Pacebacteria bacterium CG10_big_fil_rev_8_21_14_0_10_42_12]|nr:MAG: hypothetical protein COU65_03650 [Candidatus Pacebacteria bacterium CG10_big_fil_rev_8_21_14_0_10_42_12]